MFVTGAGDVVLVVDGVCGVVVVVDVVIVRMC